MELISFMAIYLFHLLPQGDARRASLQYRGRFRKSARARHPCRPGEPRYGGILWFWAHRSRVLFCRADTSVCTRCYRARVREGGGVV
jgi:hypothetical protein